MAGRYLILNAREDSERLEDVDEIPNPIETYTDEQFLKEFRLNKFDIGSICDIVKDDMFTIGHRKKDLSLEQKVLICLKTLGSGSFQNCSKDFLGVSQPTVSKTLRVFTDCMAKKAKHFIYMPRSLTEEENIKSEFFQVAGFPGVIGCIDGTDIPIKAPPIDECAYVNRKNFHSINVPAVCDANMIFLDVLAKWPGSHHDSFILQASALHEKFERNCFVDGWLLGDSGYPLKKWLMTPLSNPVSS